MQANSQRGYKSPLALSAGTEREIFQHILNKALNTERAALGKPHAEENGEEEGPPFMQTPAWTFTTGVFPLWDITSRIICHILYCGLVSPEYLSAFCLSLTMDRRIFLVQPRFHLLCLLIRLPLCRTLDSKTPPVQILSYCPMGHSNPVFLLDQFFDAVPCPHTAFQFELSRVVIHQHGYDFLFLLHTQCPLFPSSAATLFGFDCVDPSCVISSKSHSHCLVGQTCGLTDLLYFLPFPPKT